MPSLHSTASVRYKTMVVNPDGSVAKERPWKHNLILDQGLNNHNASTWAELFSVGVVGTGTTPVKRDSSTTQCSRAGTTVTADGNFFDSNDVGRLLKFDSGAEMYITAFIDATHVTVNQSGTLAASEFTIWYVNQTALITESKRTATYSQDGGDNSASFSVDTITLKRTYLFGAEAAPVTYREIGWSHTTSTAGGGQNLFGRDLIPGVGDSLLAGQQYKVVIQLTVKITPATPQAVGDVGNNGFNTSGNLMVETYGAFSKVNSNGSSGSYAAPYSAAGEPSGSVGIGFATANWTQQSSIANPGASATPSYVQGSTSKGSYTNGNFFVDYTSSIGVSQANGSLYGIVIFNDIGGSVISLKFTAAQTKDSSHTLSVVFRFSWGRTLSNA